MLNGIKVHVLRIMRVFLVVRQEIQDCGVRTGGLLWGGACVSPLVKLRKGA
jgi:hypothetical protein